jgi:predicted Fe-Mo cluster-binding NifX family protein
MKIALTTWNNRVAPVFDVAQHILIADVESGTVARETRLTVPSQPGRAKALVLAKLGVAVLICGAISRTVQSQVIAHGIEVHPFIAGDAREVLQAWIDGELEQPNFAMPGCGLRRGRRRGQGGSPGHNRGT